MKSKLPKNTVDSTEMIGMESIETADVPGLNTCSKITKMATYPYSRAVQFPQNQNQ